MNCIQGVAYPNSCEVAVKVKVKVTSVCIAHPRERL